MSNRKDLIKFIIPLLEKSDISTLEAVYNVLIDLQRGCNHGLQK